MTSRTPLPYTTLQKRWGHWRRAPSWGIRHHPAATGPLARLIRNLMDVGLPAPDAELSNLARTQAGATSLVRAANHSSLQTTWLGAWAQADLEQMGVPAGSRRNPLQQIGRISCASSTGCASSADSCAKEHQSGGGNTGQLPPATGAAGGNRPSRRRSAMRLSPLSSPKQWLKSLHSVHTGVVHKMRPSSSQSVR